MDLVLALKEDLLEEVVQLMEMMTILAEGGGSGSFSTHSRSFTAQEWAPAGSEKCLKFLQAAVWVQGESLVHDTHLYVYIRTCQLTHHLACYLF